MWPKLALLSRRSFSWAAATACIHVMSLPKAQYDSVTDPRRSHINVGSGIECTIAELAEIIARVTGFQGRLEYDDSKPDGTSRKLMDSNKLRALGWRPAYTLETGLEQAYQWYLEHFEEARH